MPVLDPQTAEALCRERGICSAPECDQPIAGWCSTCDARGPFQAPKLCARHLTAHVQRERHMPYFPYPHLYLR